MLHSWQLQEAKNKLSQLIDDAVESGPQLITRRGTEVAIVLSYADYQKIVGSSQKLSDFFRNSPLTETELEAELDLSRDQSPLRDDFVL